MVRIFKIDAKIWNAFLICVRGAASPRSSENWKASFENRKVTSEDVEGFFQRALALYVPMFPKNGAALLTVLLELV